MRTVGMRVAVLLSAVVAVAAAHAGTFTVNSTTDAVDVTPGDGVCATAAATCTLRAAVQEANAHAGPDDITLPAGTYALSLTGSKENAGATGDLDVHDELQVNGAAAATTIIDGLDGDRVFHVVAATFALRDVTIRGGQPPEDGGDPFASMGGGVFVDDAAGGGTFERVTFRENSSPVGGSGLAIASSASAITLSGCTFDDNSSQQGSALAIDTTGPVSMTDTTLTSNTSTNVTCGGGTILASTVTISGGDVSDNVGAGCGGLGIQASDGVTIDGTTFRRNQSSGFFSGGLFALATAGGVSLTNVEASENSGSNGGGIGITATGDVALTKVRVLDNGTSTSPGGGLVADVGGTLTLVDSTVSGNVSGAGGGGGVFLGAVGGLSIERTTIAQNQTTGDGVGGGGFITAGTLTITNSTISGNAAPFLAGGLLVGGGTGTIRNVTFVDNDATTGSAIYSDAGTVTVVSSIIAGAAADHCVGTVTSGGNNLDSNGSCAFAASGDQNGVDPQLGPLADNGGPTPTHLPSIDSPVLDGGAAADCPATDQRGEARPIDADGDGTAVCDIGAVEVRDNCPGDPAKLEPGVCGCGVADDAAMANGTPDCFVNGELKARIARAKAIIGALTSDQDPAEPELAEIGGSFKPYLTQLDGQVVLNGKKKKVLKLAKGASRAIAKVTKAKAGKKLEKAKKTAPKALDRFDATIAPQA